MKILSLHLTAKGQMCELQRENISTAFPLATSITLFVSVHITFPSQPNRLQPLIATRSKLSRSFQQKSINASELFKRSDWGKQKFHSLMDLMEQIQIKNNVFNGTYSSSQENGLTAWGDWTKHLESSRSVLTLRQWQGLWQLWHSINIFCCFFAIDNDLKYVTQGCEQKGECWDEPKNVMTYQIT